MAPWHLYLNINHRNYGVRFCYFTVVIIVDYRILLFIRGGKHSRFRGLLRNRRCFSEFSHVNTMKACKS